MGDWPSLMRSIEAAAEASVPGMVFDIQRIDRRNPTGLADALLQVPPFYQRRHQSSPGGPPSTDPTRNRPCPRA